MYWYLNSLHFLLWFTIQHCKYLDQRFLNFFEVGTTFMSQNSSADHLTLVPFESKYIIFLAYFNTSKWKTIAMCNFQTLRFSAIVWYAVHLNFIFSSVFFEGPQSRPRGPLVVRGP
jgi:hypothetical protein